MATLKPSPTSPTTFASGTLQFSKKTVHECAAWMPSLWSGAFCVKPGVPRSTRKAVCLTFGPLRSVTAKTRIQSAWGPLVIQFFAPLRTQPPLRLLGARHHRLRVGAAHRLGQPEAAELLARGDGREDALLLLVGPELVDRVAEERVVDAHDDAAARARGADLLHRERVAERVHPRAAVLLRDGDAEQARAPPSCARISLGQRPRLVELGGLGGDLARGEVARGVADQPLLFGQLEIHRLAQSSAARRGRECAGANASGAVRKRSRSAMASSTSPGPRRRAARSLGFGRTATGTLAPASRATSNALSPNAA